MSRQHGNPAGGPKLAEARDKNDRLRRAAAVDRTSALGLGRVKMFRPRETGDAKLNLACCRNGELESTWLARSAVSDLVAPHAPLTSGSPR
jgi:hypothetical protein